jgi:hypothetical protein
MEQYPGAIILKTNANDLQGFPDQIILYKSRWAAFEAKQSGMARHRPNQDYYVDILDEMSFARFVYPENKEDFLVELQHALRPRRRTRILVGE